VNAACARKDESPGRRVPGLFSRSVATRGSKRLDEHLILSSPSLWRGLGTATPRRRPGPVGPLIKCLAPARVLASRSGPVRKDEILSPY
jgi:hypothetical protein